jgi:hypothetical protein
MSGQMGELLKVDIPFLNPIMKPAQFGPVFLLLQPSFP